MMKKEMGNTRLFLAEIMVVIGGIFLATSLLKIITFNDYYLLLSGLFLIVVGSAWKSINKKN